MKKTALRTTAGPPTNPIQGTGTNMHTIAPTDHIAGYPISATGLLEEADRIIHLDQVLRTAAEHVWANSPIALFPL